MMKKLLSCMLALILIACAAAVPTSAGAAHADNPAAENTVLAPTAAQDYPQLLPAEANKVGIRVKWKAYSGAAKYRVFYRNDHDQWVRLGDTTALIYDHKSAEPDVDYTYTVRAVGKNGTYCSSFDSNGVTGRKSGAPAITKIENIEGGVKVTFSRPELQNLIEFEKYILRQRYEGVRLFVTGGTYGSKWKAIGDSYAKTTAAAPIDAKNSGCELKFCVRLIYADHYVSAPSEVKTATYVATPTFKVAAVPAGHQITVNKVKGAAKYRVFIKKNNQWKKLADTTGTYVNQNVKVGDDFTYTVRAMNAAGRYLSGFMKNGISIGYRAAPKLSKIVHVTGGLNIQWDAVNKAKYYRVFRKGPGDKSWVRIADVNGTSLIDYNVASGEKYTYTVRCINNLGYYISTYDPAGISAVYYGTPEICYAENGEDGITLAWTSEDESLVPAYRLFVRQNGKWVKAADTKADSYTFTGVEEGKTYTFTVRGLNAKGKYCTDYIPVGFMVTYYKKAERSYDAAALQHEISSQMIEHIPYSDKSSLAKDPSAFRFTVAYTGCYGPNTGDVTENLSTMGKNYVDYCCGLMEKYGFDLISDFDWYVGSEKLDNTETAWYLYLKEIDR